MILSIDKYNAEVFPYPTSVVLNLTDDCNLACKYCFVQQHPHYISLNVAKDAVDWVYHNLQTRIETHNISPDEKCGLSFFGGEPMLMFENIIKPLIEYIEEKYPNSFRLGITTNGTLLNETIIKYFYDHQVGILLSIDGNKTTQNFNRPCKNQKLQSFDLVSKNIPNLLQYFPDTTFRSTIYEPTAKNIFENYLFAISAGFQNVFMIPDTRGRWEQSSLNILKEQLEKITQYQINEFLNNRTPIFLKSQLSAFTNMIKYNDILSQDYYKAVRCGLGVASVSIGYDGNIYGCQEQDSRSKDSFFYLGNIYNGGIDIDRHKQLLIKYYNESRNSYCSNKQLCENCFYLNKCHMLACPSAQYELTENFAEHNEAHCFWVQQNYISILIICNYLIDKSELFNNFLSKVLTPE